MQEFQVGDNGEALRESGARSHLFFRFLWRLDRTPTAEASM